MKLKIKILLTLMATIITPAIIIGSPLVVVQSNQALAAKPIGSTCETGYAPDCLKNPSTNKVIGIILTGIRLLTALVGILAVIMIIVGGIQYTTANGNPQSVANAKKRITDVLIGVIAFVFLYAFLEWLIPGDIWRLSP